MKEREAEASDQVGLFRSMADVAAKRLLPKRPRRGGELRREPATPLGTRIGIGNRIAQKPRK